LLIFDGRAALPDAGDGSEHVFLRSLLAQAGFLGFFLWLHRSNAIHADEAYIHWWGATESQFSRIGGSERAYLPDGSFDGIIEYSATEVRESRDLILAWLKQAGGFTFAGHPMAPHSSPHDTPRLDRFRSAVSTARCAWSLDTRIALWVTALESLLSSGSSELTHRLSERAALCAATEEKERVAVYNLVKDAYRVRSAVVHGDKSPKKLYDEIPAISAAIEDIVRRSFKYVSSDQELSDALFSDESSRIDSQFLDRLFGTHKA
jgi:Apea-like HEPN